MFLLYNGGFLMNLYFALLLLAVFALFPLASSASGSDEVLEYCNPLDVPGADPGILKDGDTYYVYQTRHGGKGYEAFSSKDLVHWRREGFCFEKNKDSWGQWDFWAPEVIRHEDKYYLFYSTYSPVEKRHGACIAVSDSPTGPFEDAVAPLIKDSSESVDSHAYFDEASGRHYFYVCKFGGGRGGAIYFARLSKDLLSLDTELERVFTHDQPYDFGWVEAPFLIKHKDTYYMTYSRNGFSSPLYGVCYATAPSPEGPWTKFDRNPILTRTHEVSGPGHNCLVHSPDGKELFIAYHTHLTFAGGGHRQLAIDRLEFVPNGDGPDRLQLANEIPSVDPQPLPSGSKPMLYGKSDHFLADDLDWNRWTVYFERGEKWQLKDGTLCIEAVEGDTHQERADAANIFLQHVRKGDFVIRTKVNFTPEANHEQAFIIVWQDCNNYIRFASMFGNGHKLEIGCELNGVYDACLVPNELVPDVYLQIEKRGLRYLFSYSEDGKEWTELPVERRAVFKQIQVGLGAISPGSGASRMAKFDFIDILTPE